MQLSPLRRQRASDEAYVALRDGILAKVFSAGQRLQVEEIADKLGVSLTPVRLAMQQLANEGLIEIRPRSGTYVARLTVRDVEETFDIRCALECLAGDGAIERATPSEIEEFRAILANLAKPIKTEEARRRHDRENTRFHRLLIDCSGNRRLGDMYRGLNAHLQIVRLHARDAEWAKRLAPERAEHEEIVNALEAGNAKRLGEALRQHIMRAKQNLIDTLPPDQEL